MKNFVRQIYAYISFLIRSTNEHGVHSPFVFNWVTQCLYDRKKKTEYKIIDNLIQNISGISYPKARLLFRLGRYFKPDIIINPDTENNIIATLIKHGSPSAQIITLNQDNIKNLPYFTKRKIFCLPHDFTIHFSESLLHLLENTGNDDIWIIDSPYKNNLRTNLWKQLQQDPSTTVTIDLFCLGLVFFRKEQEKEHFIIRP